MYIIKFAEIAPLLIPIMDAGMRTSQIIPPKDITPNEKS
jgi:hypothetical protein